MCVQCIAGSSRQSLGSVPTQETVRAVSKGVHGTRGFVRKAGHSAHHAPSHELEPIPDSETASHASLSAQGKPWKKHYNKKKREKTRRLAQSVPSYY